MLKILTYDLIQTTAEELAKKYRQTHEVPCLPNVQVLEKYKNILNDKYSLVVNKVKEYILKNETESGHGFEHLEYVATMAGYFAEKECKIKNISGQAKDDIVDMAIVAGLFHDIERHLGFGEDHMIEAEKTTKAILKELNFDDKFIDIVSVVVKNHDHIDFNPEDKISQIIFGSVFDPDHIRYGFEREDTFWRMEEKRGVPPEKVIHDYQFLLPFRNAWKTTLGKEIGPKIIDFGLAIAQEVEKRFS